MMCGEHLSEFEQARAKKLAQELADKMEQYFPLPPDEAHRAEVLAIRKELEKMGFHVSWQLGLNAETLECQVSVTLWLPKAPAAP
jgi:hypothetical protein